jgi:hypothetical protein
MNTTLRLAVDLDLAAGRQAFEIRGGNDLRVLAVAEFGLREASRVKTGSHVIVPIAISRVRAW